MDSTEIFKCVAVGDEKAGTTRMIMCLAGGSFSNEYIPTMFENYSLSYNDECTIDIWDTGGMDSNDQVRSLSYSQADVVVINFSLIEPISFENVTRKWFPEVRKHLKTVPIILVGNKLDMRDDQDTAETLKSKGQVPITYYEGLKLAKEINAAKYLECSALTTKGVNAVSDEIFRIASLNAKTIDSGSCAPSCQNICSSPREENRRLSKHGSKREKTLVGLLESLSMYNWEETKRKEKQKRMINSLDEKIFELIDKKSFNEWGLFNQKHIRMCFKLGLNEVLNKLLASNFLTTYGINCGIEDRSSEELMMQRPLLMLPFEADESVVIEVLHRFSNQIYDSIDYVIPETKDNLLHVLLKRRMHRALIALMGTCDVTNILFSPNAAKDIPINIAINQASASKDSLLTITPIEGKMKKVTNIAAAVWIFMIQTRQITEISKALIHTNNKKQNILHACSDRKLNSLLTEICLSSKINKDTLKDAMYQSDADGCTPLHICTDESTILKILDIIASVGIDVCISHLDKKQNNIIHTYAKRNFVYCIRRIFKLISDDAKIRCILAQKNHNGNNPLMSCVFKNSTSALNFLLCTLFTMDYDLPNNELMRTILHSENTNGETLLGLILHYQQNMHLPETIALEMEKMCHTETDKATTMEHLTQCLRNHVEPSREVLYAIEEVNDSYEKTRCERFVIGIQLFFSSFLMPSGVMVFDIAFDILLVIGYAAYVIENIDTTIDIEDICSITNTSSNVSSELTFLKSIPEQFDWVPRFSYSLAFLVIPWIFYGIEFFHSRHLTNTIAKVKEVWVGVGDETGTKQGCKSCLDKCGSLVVKMIKIPFYVFRAVLMIILWPFWLLLKRFESARKFAIAPPQTRFDMKKEMDEDLVSSSRAQIIEAAIESSFQPILQLYLLLPVLLMRMSCISEHIAKLVHPAQLFCGETSCTSHLQFWSVLTSIISLAWSFTFYQAVRKKGALDLGANFSGRLILFLANLLQIASRLFSLILFAYSFGEGAFWQMIVSVVGHILLMSLLHYLTSDEWTTGAFKGKPFKILYHCLINGISNLYFHNWITQITNSAGTFCKSRKSGTVFRQTLFDTIFVTENLAMLIFSYIKLIDKANLGIELFVVALSSQYLGIFLKCIYYYAFHIWKETFTYKRTAQNLKESIRACCTRRNKTFDEDEHDILMKSKEERVLQKFISSDSVTIESTPIDGLEKENI